MHRLQEQYAKLQAEHDIPAIATTKDVSEKVTCKSSAPRGPHNPVFPRNLGADWQWSSQKAAHGSGRFIALYTTKSISRSLRVARHL